MKKSKVLLAAAAKEKGAVKMPDGVIYRILDKGSRRACRTRTKSCSTSKNSSPRAKNWSGKRSSHVKDLPPLFQSIVKQLGLGGSAKILTP